MIKSLFILYYLPRFARTVVYMLQSTEYQPGPYLRWFWRTQDFGRVMYRRALVPTKAARLLRLAVLAGAVLQILLGIALLVLWKTKAFEPGLWFGLAMLVSYPLVWAHLVTLPLIAGRLFITNPKNKQLIAESERIFAKHPGAKIAIAGSYGKTSMKELLLTVLGEGKKVAATPANRNVASSHAVWAKKLEGDEDALIIEYGEGAPGDVLQFARTTHPTHGVITGLAPAHLDKYKTLEAAGNDIFSLADYLNDQNVYANADSPALLPFLANRRELQVYDASGAMGWKVSKVALSVSGTSFTLTKGNKTLQLTSGLLGRHQLGPLSFAAASALELGLTDKQVQAGIAKTLPYEHRMQPRQVSGAWIIDDTYNGNIEGVRAGTSLLAALPAKRKIYVTPGLVDQGKESERVHTEMGRLIAEAIPDMVVLMQNSATPFIQQGLTASKYAGEVRVETDPLAFYTNLDQFVAAGDLVLMQNDWTDNYA